MRINDEGGGEEEWWIREQVNAEGERAFFVGICWLNFFSKTKTKTQQLKSQSTLFSFSVCFAAGFCYFTVTFYSFGLFTSFRKNNKRFSQKIAHILKQNDAHKSIFKPTLTHSI